ncbi:MAG TPA: branched-chain amino acid ABC transporter permease [Chloroflexota bacterium]|nr:branched-chain amino acid ABC transporter permease [Chloroflexota bacterium]
MFLQQLVNGVLLGSTYALIALGFTLVLGVLGLLNFALGETFMLGAFAGLLLLTSVKLPFALALLGAMATGAALAVVVYVVSFRAVKKEFMAAPILSTIGVGIMLSAVATRIWGSEQRAYPDAIPYTYFDLGAVEIAFPDLIIVGLAVALMAALSLTLTRTKLGLAMRAIAENPRTAALLGVPVEEVIIFTFVVSGALAGASGVLTGMVFHTINPFMGFNATLKGMTIMVLGGLGNVPGAMLAGLGIGLIETLSVAYGSATFRDALVFGLLIAALVFRPQGLLGTRIHEERV